MRCSWGLVRRKRALVWEILSRIASHCPRVERSWREARSCVSSSRESDRGGSATAGDGGVDSNAVVGSIGCTVAGLVAAGEGLDSGRVSDSGDVGSIDGDESENMVEEQVMRTSL